MTRPAARRGRRLTLLPLLALSIGLAGCGAAASPSPSPTATPTPTPAPTATPTPTPAATPSPSPTAAPTPSASTDPSADLKIAPPYELQELDRITSAAMQAAMAQALGSFGGILDLGFRQAVQDNNPVCIVMVMEFPGLGAAVDQPEFLDNLATGLKGEAGTVTGSTVLGHPVRIVANGPQFMGMYVRQEGVVVPICQSATAAMDVVTALIKAEP
jgi:hypothetical protein